MKLLLAVALTTTITFSMAQNTNHPHGINPKNLDTSISPGTDFYGYAVGGWQKANPIGDEYATFGTFNQLDELNNQRVRSIIENLARKTSYTDINEQNIATLYNLVTDTAKLNKDGLAPLKPYIENISRCETTAQLLDAVGKMSLMDIKCFFDVTIESDAKDSKTNLVQLMQGGTTLPDREYYIDNDEHTVSIRNAYKDFGAKVFQMLTPSMPADSAEKMMATVIRLETRLASAFKSNAQLRIAEENYNKIPFSQLERDYEEVNWRRLFFESAQCPQFAEISVCQPEATKEACRMIKEESLSDLKTYVLFRLCASTFSYLGDAQRDLAFDFFGRTLQGRKAQQPIWRRGVITTNDLLGEAVGKIYVSKYFPESAKKSMEKLVENLRVALGERIEAQEWMSQETKKKAQEKLGTFYVKIGYPNKWRDYSKLQLSLDMSLLDAVMSATRFNNLTDIREMVGKPVDRDKWYMTPQTVNAYYNPPTNEICFPAGILQYPFFDEKADDAFNYGAIGVVIGHEMTHGFDDQGRKYDKDGNMSDWWSLEDQERFNKRAKVMEEFFDSIKVLPDLHANGALTLGENLADHGGLQVAFTALKNATKDKKQKNLDGFSPSQRFFLAYAGVWAGNIREAEIRRRTKSDPHALAKWRVNGALPHIDAWYEAFHITENAPLFVPKDKRVTIW